MKKRIITGLILCLILGPAAYFGGIYFLICGLFVTIHAAYEMMNMFSKKYPILKGMKYVVPIMCALLVLVIYFATTKGAVDQTIMYVEDGTLDSTFLEGLTERFFFYSFVLATFILLNLICFAISLFKKGSDGESMMCCATTLAYCGLLLGTGVCVEYITPYASINLLPSGGFFGGRSFVYLVVICIISDVVAYLFGSKFGKHKLAPNISPNKSYEGAIAGVVSSGIIATTIATIPWKYTLFDVSVYGIWGKVIAIGCIFLFSCVIAIFGIFGDLIASKFKRTYEIKDYGTILPGHGGILDRFDSLIFASAFYAVVIEILQLVILGVTIW